MYFNTEDINKIRKGYYSALYFNRAKTILLKEKNFKIVTMQIFQKNNKSVLCGVDEVLELLKVGTGYWEKNRWIDKFKELKVEHLYDGDIISSWQSVMHIIGPYMFFAHLESLYLGILARRTLIASNSKKIVDAAKGKQVIFFGDRFDDFKNQEGDGYAAHVGGINTVCTEAQARHWKGSVAGTIPHGLIAINNGDTVESTLQFAKHIKDRIIALVDFDNDCINTSLKVAKVLRQQLWGVRIDTAENLVDKSLERKTGKKYFGVNPTLVKLLRKTLDKNKFNNVKIIVSGGFNEDKIRYFEFNKTPVDIYGVGSALLKGINDFTADIVKVGDKNLAKYGRKYKKLWRNYSKRRRWSK
ncbi:Nicotinate phosphoribosyltransferase [Candidatus Roizmanbacteria bacterium]|nr:Nicotinate phosphoribosyltransferase [Candidatus Roizmanbacteria bacterium]